jgi:hypothetical protein
MTVPAEQQKIKALLSVLAKSASSGIHASLSPEDCRSLLMLIRQPKSQSKRRKNIFDEIQKQLSDLTKEAIDELMRKK